LTYHSRGITVDYHAPREEEKRRDFMKARIDEDLCVGDGTCVEICPEMFEMAGDLAVVKKERVPEELEDLCREAAESCVVEAITIDE
jgi:ferredoxin